MSKPRVTSPNPYGPFVVKIAIHCSVEGASSMKRFFTATAFAVFCSLLSGLATAAQRPAMCKLVVKGKAYINGQCQFEADRDGSFRIFGKDYFAYVNVEGKTAEASWNADPKSTHAQAPLGTLTRKGACWVMRQRRFARAGCRQSQAGEGARSAAEGRNDLSRLPRRIAKLHHVARPQMG